MSQKFSLIISILLFALSFATGTLLAQTPGSVWHRAEEIKPGVFGQDVGSGAYTFPGDLNVDTGQITAGTKIKVGSSELSSAGLTVNSNSLVVTSTGNVGIGLTNPTKTFQIGNASNSSSIYNDYIGTINNMVFESRDSNDGGAFIFRSNSDSGTQDLVKIDRFGNVGIGTTSPGQKLEVNGGIRLNTTTAKPPCDSTTRGTLWFTQGTSGAKDAFEVCTKTADDSYAWQTIY